LKQGKSKIDEWMINMFQLFDSEVVDDIFGHELDDRDNEDASTGDRLCMHPSDKIMII
jgi:hypothetical protein